MELRFQVVNEINVREGIGKNGQPYRMVSQVAAVFDGGHFPKPFELSLEDEKEALPAGFYTSEGPLFSAGQYGLELDRRNLLKTLRPVPAGANKAA